MDAITLDAEPRDVGKKATKEVRASNHVPCILYGPETDATPFQLSLPALRKLIFRRTAQVVEIKINGDSWNCILKDYDLDPISDNPQHADFQVLREGREITLTVPIRFQGTPQGQKEGGDTQINLRQITISCLPKNIPSEISVDISELEIGDALHVSDIETEGLDFRMSPSQTVVSVVAPRTLEVLEAEEEEEEVLEEGELEEGELPEGEEGEAPEGEEEPAPEA
jgi:large subunit ribosomal protein L25